MQAGTSIRLDDLTSREEHHDGASLTSTTHGPVPILELLPWILNPNKQLEKLTRQSELAIEGATVTTQPEPKEDLELGTAVAQAGEEQNASANGHKRRSRWRRWQGCSSPLRCYCGYLPTCCFSCFFRAEKAFGMAGGACVFVIMFLIIVALSLASIACGGAIWMLVGNTVLRAAHLPGYIDSNKVVAIVGLVGGLFAPICVGLFLTITCVPKTEWRGGDEWDYAWWVNIPATVCTGALVGPIGVSILRRHSFDLEGFDILHATRAGALGPAILIPALLLLKPVAYVVLGVICTPLWIAMQMGLEFVYIKANQTLPDFNSENMEDIPNVECSWCICIGSLRGDEELLEEV